MVGVVWAAGRRQAMPSLLDPPARDCVCQTLSSSHPGLSLHGAPLASESSIAARSRDGDSVGRCCCSSLCDFPCMVASWLQCFWDDAVRPCRRCAQETAAELALSLSAICLHPFFKHRGCFRTHCGQNDQQCGENDEVFAFRARVVQI